MSRLAVKAGVQPPLIKLVTALANVAQHALFADVPELVITAGIDGKHLDGSKHYQLAAIDIRTRNLDTTQTSALLTLLRRELPAPTYDLILEVDHIHVEFDPK